MKVVLQILLVLSVSTVQIYGAGKNVNTCSNVCGGNNVSCRGLEGNCDVGSTTTTTPTTSKTTTTSTTTKVPTESDPGFIGPKLPETKTADTTKKDESLFDQALKAAKGFVGLNVAKDRIALNTNKAKVVNLGIIRTSREQDLSVPAANSMNIIQFTPSQGFSSGRSIEVLLASFDLTKPMPANLPAALKKELELIRNGYKTARVKMYYVVKIYSRRQGEREWYDHEEFQTSENPVGMKIPAVIEPNGVIRVTPQWLQTRPDGSKADLQEVAIDFGQLS